MFAPRRRFIITIFTLGIVCSGSAKAGVDLAALAKGAAVEMQESLPGSKAEVTSGTVLVSRNTMRAPNMYTDLITHSVVRQPGYMDVPREDGVMFVVRFLKGGPPIYIPNQHKWNELPFDSAHITREAFFLKESTYRKFTTSDVTVIVDILFNKKTSRDELQRAYSKLLAFVNTQLKT